MSSTDLNKFHMSAEIATLAALFSSSVAVAVGSNPAANAGIGAGVVAHISYMRALLITGGSCGSNILGSKVKDFKVVLDIHPIHPYREQFTANCQITSLSRLLVGVKPGDEFSFIGLIIEYSLRGP